MCVCACVYRGVCAAHMHSCSNDLQCIFIEGVKESNSKAPIMVEHGGADSVVY